MNPLLIGLIALVALIVLMLLRVPIGISMFLSLIHISEPTRRS